MRFMKFYRTLSVAPMMAYTDRHFRYLLRLIHKDVLLYTEMLHAKAVLHGRRDLLYFSEREHPIALQLGGADANDLAHASKIAEKYGYDEVNLNVGCPSERVQSGCFGAALMKEPDLVATLFSSMQNAVQIPVTIKTRLGVDDVDSDDYLQDFIGKIAEAGCKTFILHARKAWLKGLSPKENRDMPPLQYERVYRIKQLFPQLEIIINGGIRTHEAVAEHLKHVDGVMVGRIVCEQPFWLSKAQACACGSPINLIQAYLPYILREYATGVPMRHMTRHLIGLFQGEPGARAWRQALSAAASPDDLQLLKAIKRL